MYQAVFTNCKRERGIIDLDLNSDPYARFATYADRLMSGLDIGITMPGAHPEAHIDQVALYWVDDLRPDEKEILITTCFLLCPCKIQVEEKKRAQSALLTPKEKLYLHHN